MLIFRLGTYNLCSVRARCVKETSNLSMACPHLVYFHGVWSPSTKGIRHRIEIVERHAACFVTDNYRQASTGSFMFKDLIEKASKNKDTEGSHLRVHVSSWSRSFYKFKRNSYNNLAMPILKTCLKIQCFDVRLSFLSKWNSFQLIEQTSKDCQTCSYSCFTAISIDFCQAGWKI